MDHKDTSRFSWHDSDSADEENYEECIESRSHNLAAKTHDEGFLSEITYHTLDEDAPPESAMIYVESVQTQPISSNYGNQLVQLFPNVDHNYLSECGKTCESEGEFKQIVASLLDSPDLVQNHRDSAAVPTQQTVDEHPFFLDEPELNANVICQREAFPIMSSNNDKRYRQTCTSDDEVIMLAEEMASSSRQHARLETYVEDDYSGNNFSEAQTKHRRIIELVEMFPDMSISVIEHHAAQFDADVSLALVADALIQMEPREPTACVQHSQRLLQLVEMFPNIEVNILEQKCEEVGPNQPLNTVIEAIMAADRNDNPTQTRHINNNLLQLVQMFPNIEVRELENVCQMHDPNDSFTTLANFVANTHCFQVVLPEEEQGAAALLLEEDLEQLDAYQTLLNILPNADPDFLREKFESFAGDDGALKRFTEEALESQTYPTYEDYTKRSQKNRMQRQYRDKFHPKNYLEEITDPFSYFGSKTYAATKPVCDQEKAFLKSRYQFIDDETIDLVLKNEKYNLFKTCKMLDKYEGPLADFRETDPYHDCYNDVISRELLQEIALIENEESIRTYIRNQDATKQRALEQARKQNELHECSCCCNDSVLLEDMSACSDGHLFCTTCVRTHTEVLIGEGKLLFPCLEDCGKNFTLHTLKAVLKPSIFFKMAQRQQLEEVQAANIDELETCPFCDFGAIPLPSDKVFTCLNTDCMKISCRYCKEPNHIPLRCDELPERDEQVKARTQIEDQMTKALLRECYKCKKKFVKTDGCNKMTCSCGAIMCYICRKPVRDYSHFNGQGGDALNKCPLWSKNEELHEKAVEEAAVRAKQEIVIEAKNKNPRFELKYDPTLMLP